MTQEPPPTDWKSYGIDLGIGTVLIGLGLHYAAVGWPARTAIIAGLSIIGLAIAAQNARFAVDMVVAVKAIVSRRYVAFADAIRKRKAQRIERVRIVEPEVMQRAQTVK